MNTSSFIVNVLSFLPLIVAVIWTYMDAKAIGDDHGQMPGLVSTQPVKWATGVFLMLIIVFPLYLFMRVRFKRLAAERKLQVFDDRQSAAPSGIWPPPPDMPTF